MSSPVPIPQYCDPDYVAETLGIPDPNQPGEILYFTNKTNPSYDHVCKMIASNEKTIDEYLKKSWRINYVYGRTMSIPKYWQDEASIYSDTYIKSNGNVIQLHKNVLEWDPRPIYKHIDEDGHVTYDDEPDDPEDPDKSLVYPGDRIELRQFSGGWRSISGNYNDGSIFTDTFDIDYPSGRLKLRLGSYLFARPRVDALRITYRWGEDPSLIETYPVLGGIGVPENIRRWCAIRTASQILTSQFSMVKVGMGGNMASDKNSTIQQWTNEENQIYTAMRRIGRVVPMIRK